MDVQVKKNLYKVVLAGNEIPLGTTQKGNSEVPLVLAGKAGYKYQSSLQNGHFILAWTD
jgi:hypothetical protein